MFGASLEPLGASQERLDRLLERLGRLLGGILSNVGTFLELKRDLESILEAIILNSEKPSKTV